MTQPFYLRSDVFLEPLFNQWFAWPYLISPAAAAMNIANHHTKIMKSYIANPKAHAVAVKNPALLGGPFMDFPAERESEIRALLERTIAESGDMIEFAAAVKAFDLRLLEESDGSSLESWYATLPAPLRGYVELVYDLNNQPSLRFIEALLYRSCYYKRSAQSVSLGLMQGDSRPFVLSTPRPPSEETLNLKVPFDHPFIDALFAMRATPQTQAEIRALLGDAQMLGGLPFEKLFTTKAPPSIPDRPPPGELRIRYFGHACVLFETSQVAILADPVISYAYPSEIPRYTMQDLPEHIDYVVITHSHQDHLHLETLLQLRHKIGQILVPKNNGGSLADPSLKLLLRHVGFPSVTEMEDLDGIDLPDGGRLEALPFLGEHADMNIRSKAAYFLNLVGKRIIVGADSSNLDPNLYRHLHHLTGDIHMMFLGMECVGGPMSWLYGPLLSKPLNRKKDHSRRFTGCDFKAASAITDLLNVGEIYIYAMGSEPWLNYFMSVNLNETSKPIVEANKLIEHCNKKNSHCERLFGCKEIIRRKQN